MALQHEAVNTGTDIIHCTGAKKLLEYNETDCKIMSEILQVFREKYLPKDGDENGSESDSEMPIKLGKRKRNVIPSTPSPSLKQSKRKCITVNNDDRGLEKLITGKWKQKRNNDDDEEEVSGPEDIDSIASVSLNSETESMNETETIDSESDNNSWIEDDGDDLYIANGPQKENEETLEKLPQIGVTLDNIKIAEVLAKLINNPDMFNQFQKNQIADQLKILIRPDEYTPEYQRQLNYLLYYTQTHDAYNINKYTIQPTKEQIDSLESIKTLEYNHRVDFNDIFEAPLTNKEKAILFEKMFIYHNMDLSNPERFTLRNEIRRIIDDSKALTEEQRNIINLAPDKRDNYLARIADSNHSNNNKAQLIARYKKAVSLGENDSDRNIEFRILDYALSLPTTNEVSTIIDIDASLLGAKSYLDTNICGMENIKEEFLLYMLETALGQGGKSKIIGLCGSPGIGKSTFASSIGMAFNQPIYRINMGGISDGSMLIGSAPVWIGADIGLFARALITCRKKKCIIILEEIDKISKAPHGEEIMQLLTHILDPTFNDQITDKFLGLSFSLHDVTFVVTLNEKQDLPPVIRNRIRLFELPDPTIREKKQTCKQIIIPRLCSDYGFFYNNDIIVPDSILTRLVQMTEEDKGLRSLESLLTTIFRKLMALRKLKPETSKILFSFSTIISFPLVLTEVLIDELLKNEKLEKIPDWLGTYII